MFSTVHHEDAVAVSVTVIAPKEWRPVSRPTATRHPLDVVASRRVSLEVTP